MEETVDPQSTSIQAHSLILKIHRFPGDLVQGLALNVQRDALLVLDHALYSLGAHSVDKEVQAVRLAMLRRGAVFGLVQAAAEPSESVPDHTVAAP